MSKFAKTAPLVQGSVTSTIPALTHEGGIGYERNAKSELFLLAVTNMVGEQTFYESGDDRDARFQRLIHQVTTEDPAWVAGFVPYLRDTMQMRSASVVVAAEYVAAGGPEGRHVVASALQRPDEPAEVLAYWFNRHGRRIPKPLKRGVADAAVRLYDERSLLKYDTRGPWRFADVLELTHPKPRESWQDDLFALALARRHGREPEVPASLTMIRARVAMTEVPEAGRRAYMTPERLKEAGMTWEALSSWLGTMDAGAWEAVIPSMGYMALLRNLRNFEQGGVASDVLNAVAMRIADPEQVTKSRQFPIRFYSAWKASGSMTFGVAVEKALQASLSNVVALPGRSLVLVDCSGSMFSTMSERSKVERYELAGVFGAALALRAESADLYAYGSTHVPVSFRKGDSALRLVEQFSSMGGTQTWETVRATYRGHDRIIILTDEQAFYDIGGMPDGVKLFTFNLAGYQVGHAPSGRDGSYTFGGLTDAGFRMLALLDRGRDAGWPWDSAPPAPVSPS